MSETKWKKFEKLAYKIQKDLAGNADVKLNDSIKGADSGTPRQIDISIRKQVGQFPLLLVIDCKDYQARVDVKDIGEFVTTVRDVRANKGAIISSSGFTEAAIALAKHHGIDTFRLVDTQSTDWRAYVSIPVLLERSYIIGFRLQFQDFEWLPKAALNTDFKLLKVFSQDGKLEGIIGDILASKWNKQEIRHEPGDCVVLIGKNVLVELEGQKFPVTLMATVRVGRKYYFGHLPIHIRGLMNEQDGGLLTKEFTTADIEPFKIEQGLMEGWSEIENPDELAVKPFLRMGYSDAIPTSHQPPES